VFICILGIVTDGAISLIVELVQVELGEHMDWLLADFSRVDRGCAQGGCICQGACHQAVTKLTRRGVFIFAFSHVEIYCI
jgi:hypothetical protein